MAVPCRFRSAAALFVCAFLSGAIGCGSPTKPGNGGPPPAPGIACPDAVSVTSPNGQPYPVSYGLPLVTNGQPPLNTVCTPATGSVFNIGTAGVTCTTTDALSRTATCNFTVTVTLPAKTDYTEYVAFGDSITQGQIVTAATGWRPMDIVPGADYPAVLQVLMRSRYTSQVITVKNAGNPGETVADAVSDGRFSSVITVNRPQVLLLIEGANDLSKASFLGENPMTAIAPTVAGLRTMVRDAFSRGVKAVIVGSLTPQNPAGRNGGEAAYIVPFNDQLRLMTLGEGASYVDLYTALNADINTYIGPDGLHPTAQGYQKIAQTFFDQLKLLFEHPGTTTSTPSFGVKPRPLAPGSSLNPLNVKIRAQRLR